MSIVAVSFTFLFSRLILTNMLAQREVTVSVCIISSWGPGVTVMSSKQGRVGGGGGVGGAGRTMVHVRQRVVD